MSQQNFYPSASSDDQQIEHKIMLLYLINKMDIPLSNSQIAQFALDENYMNYYNVQEYLTEMVGIGYLDMTKDKNTTRYTITDEGLVALDTFIKYVPPVIKNSINKYVSENRKLVKQDFEVTANHFYDHNNNEFLVKCGVYEDEMMLMEVHVSVVSKEQALCICNNWKSHVNTLYGDIISTLLDGNEKKDSPKESED